MSKIFWIGIIGGITGILAGVFATLVGSVGEAFNASSVSSLYMNAAGAIVFSVVGIAGGALETKKILGGLLMIIGALGVLISVSLFGVLACVLFVIGAILIFARKDTSASMQTAHGEARS